MAGSGARRWFFIGELRRRNVLRAAALYVAGVWALALGIAQLGPAFGLPEWGTRWFVIAAIIGFPLWIAFAWLRAWHAFIGTTSEATRFQC
jgi:hypothetical protein